MKLILTFILSFYFGVYTIYSQETIDAGNATSFIFGGDQKFQSATINLLPLEIVDVEPEPDNGVYFGISANTLEAGAPVMGTGGIMTDETLWLNYTHRANNNTAKAIYVQSNQPVPDNIQVLVEILTEAKTGDYKASGVKSNILISEFPQLIIDDFDSGYTGSGLGMGYQLKYTVENPEGKSLPSDFEIIYEIK